MCNLMSLKLRTRNQPSLQLCFSGMPLISVPIYGVKMSSKPSKWQFDTICGRHERNWRDREFSVAEFIFTYVQKCIWPSYGVWGGGAIAPSLPLCIRHWFTITVWFTQNGAVDSPAATSRQRRRVGRSVLMVSVMNVETRLCRCRRPRCRQTRG